MVWDHEVGGSNPPTPTNEAKPCSTKSYCLLKSSLLRLLVYLVPNDNSMVSLFHVLFGSNLRYALLGRNKDVVVTVRAVCYVYFGFPFHLSPSLLHH